MANPRSEYTDRANFFQGAAPADLLARFGSPLYVYSEKILRERCRELKKLSSHDGFEVSYSVKANSNPSLLKIIREEGLHADAMSPGELEMDFMAGYEPSQILYISNNNDPAETLNALGKGCLISVDSLSQLETLGSLAPGERVLVRLNPGIGEGHHAKVVTGGADSKFGVDPSRMHEMADILKKYDLTLVGFNQHIGSLFMAPDKYMAAASLLLEIVDHLPHELYRNFGLIDFGGGFGIPYRKYEGEERLNMEELGSALHGLITDWSAHSGFAGNFVVEPGRYVVAECGLLLGQVTATKNNGHHHFVGTDIGFNILMRPMLYGSWHDIEIYGEGERGAPIPQTVVGNICESGDIVAKDRLLPPMRTGDIIGILDAGAYGFSMASNYNERLLPAEILLTEDGGVKLIRRRQTLADLATTLQNLD